MLMHGGKKKSMALILLCDKHCDWIAMRSLLIGRFCRKEMEEALPTDNNVIAEEDAAIVVCMLN